MAPDRFDDAIRASDAKVAAHTPNPDDRMKAHGGPGEDSDGNDMPPPPGKPVVNQDRHDGEQNSIGDDLRFDAADQPFAAQVAECR